MLFVLGMSNVRGIHSMNVRNLYFMKIRKVWDLYYLNIEFEWATMIKACCVNYVTWTAIETILLYTKGIFDKINLCLFFSNVSVNCVWHHKYLKAFSIAQPSPAPHTYSYSEIIFVKSFLIALACLYLVLRQCNSPVITFQQNYELDSEWWNRKYYKITKRILHFEN